MWSKLGKIFLTGLAAILPVAITLALLWWLAATAESFLGAGIKLLVPDAAYVPGMGVIAGLALIFATGILLRAWAFRKLFGWGEQLLNRIPLVKSVYGAVRDLIGFMSGEQSAHFNKVVTVELPGLPGRLVGFVTREDFSQLPDSLAGQDEIAVYLPMSYQIGGYTLLLPRDAVKPVDMSLEEGMRFAVTAGMSVKK